jgi:hypothetical protein
MAAIGVLGEYKGSQAREVIMTLEEYEELCESMQAGDEDSEDKEPVEAEENAQKRHYESSAEGEYHYAAVEEED